MKPRDSALKAKRFETAEKARKVASLESMIRDFDLMASDLTRQIAAEEERTGIGSCALRLFDLRQGGRPAPRQPADVDCRPESEARGGQAGPRRGNFRVEQAGAGGGPRPPPSQGRSPRSGRLRGAGRPFPRITSRPRALSSSNEFARPPPLRRAQPQPPRAGPMRCVYFP